MKYHALFVILEKAALGNCHLLKIIGGALWVNTSFLVIKMPFMFLNDFYLKDEFENAAYRIKIYMNENPQNYR